MTDQMHTGVTEVVSSRGGVVRVGQIYRDARPTRYDTIRILRVDGFRGRAGTSKAACTVVREDYRGEITEPMRRVNPAVDRLTGRDFVLVVDDREHLAGVLADHVAESITMAAGVGEVLVECSCGAEIAGPLASEPETQVGAVQQLMAAHIADAIAEATGRDGAR
ncbi:hypothetical protein ACWESM_18680 [Nocardia sp. NPDC003999]